ncbi:hypothetical protein LENED_000413 [Lentinula edodes]|uniref:Uncharacterized protein n=1 Tax=Lentinula edodes TaxID=5353 RepID=A0A1Q3DVM7_LENED|nr:hypothetical protein LENED_000413 [Lentinula edodes]
MCTLAVLNSQRHKLLYSYLDPDLHCTKSRFDNPISRSLLFFLLFKLNLSQALSTSLHISNTIEHQNMEIIPRKHNCIVFRLYVTRNIHTT